MQRSEKEHVPQASSVPTSGYNQISTKQHFFWSHLLQPDHSLVIQSSSQKPNSVEWDFYLSFPSKGFTRLFRHYLINPQDSSVKQMADNGLFITGSLRHERGSWSRKARVSTWVGLLQSPQSSSVRHYASNFLLGEIFTSSHRRKWLGRQIAFMCPFHSFTNIY